MTTYRLQFPVDRSGSSTTHSTTYYSDFYYQIAGQRVAAFGGQLNYESGAGLFCWALTYASSHKPTTVGGRLVKKEL